MASPLSINMSIRKSWETFTDMFVFGSVATAIAVMWFGGGGDLRTILAAMFAALAVAFFAVSLHCFIQYRGFRRLAYEQRMEMRESFAVIHGGNVAPSWGVDRNAVEGAPKGNRSS